MSLSLSERLSVLFKGKVPSSPQPDTFRQIGSWSAGGQDGAQPAVNFDAVYYALENHDITIACFQQLMDETGKEGYDYAPTDPEQEEPDQKAVEAAEKVLRGVTGLQNIRRKFQEIVMHTRAVGNDYWFIQRNSAGEAIGTVQVHPSTVTIFIDDAGQVKAYAQQMNGKTPKVFRPEDMVHFKGMPHPRDSTYGLGALQPLVYSVVASDQKAAILNQKLLDNGMNISGIARLKDGIGEADFQRISQHLRDQFSGYRNSGRMLIAEGVEGIDKVGASFSDMQFLELMNSNVERICATLKVPMAILGIHESGTLGADSAKADRLTLYSGAIRPLETMIEETINNELFPKCGIEGIRFEFNVSSSVEEKEMKDSTREDVTKGILTINEARYERGLDAFDENELPLASKPFILTGTGPITLDEVMPAATDSSTPDTQPTPAAPPDHNTDTAKPIGTGINPNDDKAVIAFLKDLERRL